MAGLAVLSAAYYRYCAQVLRFAIAGFPPTTTTGAPGLLSEWRRQLGEIDRQPPRLSIGAAPRIGFYLLNPPTWGMSEAAGEGSTIAAPWTGEQGRTLKSFGTGKKGRNVLSISSSLPGVIDAASGHQISLAALDRTHSAVLHRLLPVSSCLAKTVPLSTGCSVATAIKDWLVVAIDGCCRCGAWSRCWRSSMQQCGGSLISSRITVVPACSVRRVKNGAPAGSGWNSTGCHSSVIPACRVRRVKIGTPAVPAEFDGVAIRAWRSRGHAGRRSGSAFASR